MFQKTMLSTMALSSFSGSTPGWLFRRPGVLVFWGQVA
jgi:hypothetical protein